MSQDGCLVVLELSKVLCFARASYVSDQVFTKQLRIWGQRHVVLTSIIRFSSFSFYKCILQYGLDCIELPLTYASLMTRLISDAGWRLENSYTKLPDTFFSCEQPTPVRYAGLTLLNKSLTHDLGLKWDILESSGASIFVGNELPNGSTPIAQAYAGHQFGHFTNLGDGRAILLGEQITPEGKRLDIQLKGAGRTKYSRGGDGRAALGPMLREYIISEGMHALGIPTTRSLAVTATGETVFRNTSLPGAILTRVAASHIRVGTFQYAAALGNRENLSALLDYTIRRHDPDVLSSEEPLFPFLESLIDRQAQLLAHWMLIGFVHGVMNTDNMALSGETIDYGPCAFMDVYHPDTVFSSIDQQGRYAYANQPAIAQWNLARLAESLMQLIEGPPEKAVEKLIPVVNTFSEKYNEYYLAGARKKIGIVTSQDGDLELFESLLNIMQDTQADFTSTFVALGHSLEHDVSPSRSIAVPAFKAWRTRWQHRLDQESGSHEDAAARMKLVNPVIIPRNHIVEEALKEAESGNLDTVQRLLDVLNNPFTETAENIHYRDGSPPESPPYCTFCGT